MKKTKQNNFLHNLWKYLLAVLLIAGMLASCDQITGSGDDNKENEQPGPDPQPETEAAVITSFSASDEIISEGETVTLTWEVSGDGPITLTLQPGSIDVSGETDIEVTPEEDTTYQLIAENEAGSDESEVEIRVVAAGATALEIEISGLPGGANANIAVTDHDDFMQWVTENNVLSDLPPGSFTVVAAPVTASGVSYVPGEGIQTVDVAKTSRNTTIVQVNYSLAAGSLYAEEPDIEACDEGAITQEAKERGLMYLNFIRALTGLPPVAYDPGSDDMVQKAALMMAANSELSHFPPEDWHCYTEAGADGAEVSNLGIDLRNQEINSTPEFFMGLYADDWRVPILGHRRWVLDPFLREVAIGLVEGTPITGEYSHAAGSAVRVVGGPMADIDDLELPFIAYPRGDFPSQLFTNDWFLSFSVIVDRDSRFGANEQVNYSSVEITVVEKESDLSMSVTDIAVDHTAYGIPNSLQWKVPDLRDNRTYTVTITDVRINGESRDFSYEVHLK